MVRHQFTPRADKRKLTFPFPFLIFRLGGYAEYVSMPKASVSRPVTLPSNFSWDQFAAIPETFVTCTQT